MNFSFICITYSKFSHSYHLSKQDFDCEFCCLTHHVCHVCLTVWRRATKFSTIQIITGRNVLVVRPLSMSINTEGDSGHSGTVPCRVWRGKVVSLIWTGAQPVQTMSLKTSSSTDRRDMTEALRGARLTTPTSPNQSFLASMQRVSDRPVFSSIFDTITAQKQ